ncbi:gamma-aminobutyric acid type B receptor subunit 2-like [Asterias rubens]|uniref:gamma-aminobutyric acid type B receptor subunit 2-like n=1 Tax=Asterias rubens TaxID=7604 RepID=UPI0014558B65|nr:gamma-aminobutyric acid type B receptor subunit 2-like [Asterias rubens]
MQSSASFGTAFAQIIRQFGWEKIALLYRAGEPHQARMAAVNDEALVSNFSIFLAESFLNDPYESLLRLKGKDARIIATSFYEDTAREVFCKAFHLGLYGPNYVWMVPGYFPDNWQQKTDGVNCTADQLKTATEGYLAVTFNNFERSNEITSCGKSTIDFQLHMEDVVGYTLTRTDAALAALGYDGMWALATAMHQAETLLRRRLDTYQYGDEEYARVVGDTILNLEFSGLSGPVKFTKTGARIGNLLVEQNIAGEDIIVGTFDNIKKKLHWNIPVENLWYYSGGHPPYDSDITVTIVNLQATPLLIVAIMSVLAILGIVLALMFLGFNFWKRKHKQIKMSSPNINNFIACGIMMAYVCVMLLGIDRSMVDDNSLVTICKTRSWLIAVAFTLAFGGMFSKTWRVYSIIIYNKTKKKVIKDRYLFGIIVVLLLVDFAILIPWQIIDPLHIEEVRINIPQTEDDLANYRRYEMLYVNCTSESNNIWMMVILVYKAFVVVFGAFLAWSTRNINVPGLNDSYYVGLSIYNTVICCVVAVPLSFLSVSSIGVTYGLVSSFMLFCITTSLCMMFFPKLNAVYRNKVEENSWPTGLGFITGTTHISASIGRDVQDTDLSNVPTISNIVKS